METKKDLLNFFNDAVFYDYENIGIISELDQFRRCIINSFYKTIPYTRILVCLSIIDDIVLKICNNLGDVHNLRENIIYMLSGEKTIRDDKQTIDGKDNHIC